LPVIGIDVYFTTAGCVLKNTIDWLPVFRSLGARQWSGGRLMVSSASRVFDQNGVLVDESVRQRLEQFIQGILKFCEI